MRTNNLEEMQKKVGTIRKQSKKMSIIDYRKGVEYTDLYVLLERGKKMDLKPAELIKKAAETILALNKEIDLDDLIYNTGECCKFYGTLKQHTDLLAEICRNSYSNGPQNLSPNSVARYIFPNCNKIGHCRQN